MHFFIYFKYSNYISTYIFEIIEYQSFISVLRVNGFDFVPL